MSHRKKLVGALPSIAIASALHEMGAAFAILLVVISPAAAQEPQAKELQQRAAARVTSYREHLRKTGDKAARADDLVRAVQELDKAYRVFLAADDASQAAACRIEAGDACQLQGKFEEALKLYAEGETLARKANAPLSQAHLRHHESLSPCLVTC